MAVNRRPRFSGGSSIQWGGAFITAANTAKDGTGTVTTIATAGADGMLVQKLVARSVGTNVATVLRVFMNNGGVNTTASNNSLIAEMTLPATTISEVAAQPTYELGLNLDIPATYKINVTIGTAVAAGYQVTAIGGSFTDVA